MDMLMLDRLLFDANDLDEWEAEEALYNAIAQMNRELAEKKDERP